MCCEPARRRKRCPRHCRRASDDTEKGSTVFSGITLSFRPCFSRSPFCWGVFGLVSARFPASPRCHGVLWCGLCCGARGSALIPDAFGRCLAYGLSLFLPLFLSFSQRYHNPFFNRQLPAETTLEQFEEVFLTFILITWA